MPRGTNLSVSTMGIDIGKNSFHVVGLDQAMDYRREEATASQRAGHRARRPVLVKAWPGSADAG
jgi:hypothetical protein